jgi:phage portal protein BeeE
MQIDRTGWGNATKQRNFDLGERPVFVQGPFGDQTPFPANYEYTGDAPAALSRSIESIINGSYNKQNFINLFYCLPEIFAPVNEIATRVADADWQLRRTMDDAPDTTNKQFNKLFTEPNPLMSFKQFVYQAVCYELLTGAVFQYVNQPSVLPDEYQSIITWMNIPTQAIKVNRKNNADPYSATELTDLVSGYSIGQRTFEVNNVMSVVNHDLRQGNVVDGFVSPLMGAKLAIRNLIPVYEARGVIFIKRGALGFLVSRKSDESGLISLTKTEKEEAQREFQNTYGLRADKNQVGVASAPVDFIKTSMSIAELLPFDETLADALAIYKCLRVPRHLVPSKDNSTFANADADEKAFYTNVVIPMANRYAMTWNNRFKIPNRYIYPDFSTVSVLQENRKDKATVDQINGNIYLQRYTTGVCSLNDWIKANGDQPVVGNDLYDKKMFELTPEQVAIVKNIINLKAVSTGTPSKTGAPEKPTIE